MGKKIQDVSGFSTMSPAMEFANNYYQWILESFRPYIKNNVLEIGTGQGNLKNHISWVNSYVSLDVDPKVIHRAQERDPDGNYLLADIADPINLKPLKELNIDTILCINVLEHIKDDRAAVQNMLRILINGGNLLLFVPAFPYLYSIIDQLAGHYRRYTKKSIKSLFSDLRGEWKEIKFFNFIGGIGWGVNKWIKTEKLNHPCINKQVEIFNGYFVVPSKFLDLFTNKFFGQSLLCIFSK